MMAQRMICGRNLSGIGNAMLVYASDYNEKYPTPDQWNDLLINHANVSRQQFDCPAHKDDLSDYAMNENIVKFGPSAPPDMVLVFESKPGWNLYGGPELIDPNKHCGDGCNVLFNDGHVNSFFQKVSPIFAGQQMKIKWPLFQKGASNG